MGMVGQKILIVEDDDSLRPALERLLNAAGWLTTAYPSAEALLADPAAGAAACVVCDLKLLAMSGFDLLVKWRGRGGRPLLILMTAYDTPGLGEEAVWRGGLSGRTVSWRRAAGSHRRCDHIHEATMNARHPSRAILQCPRLQPSPRPRT